MVALLASLRDFLLSGFRPGNRLARSITVLLLIKVSVLVAIKIAFFSPDHTLAPADATARNLLPTATVEEEHAQ